MRFLVSFLNPLLTTAAVIVFYSVLTVLGVQELPSFIVSLIYGLGTLAWPYAGTCFSEPLATLLVLASFFLLVNSEKLWTSTPTRVSRRLLLSGAAMGLACAAHVTALLFVPLFAAQVFWGSGARSQSRMATRAVGAYLAGAGAILLMLGLYNAARFGNLFETGRFVSLDSARRFGYGTPVAPWRGIYGLLASPGKGIVWYCPAVIAGVLAWGCFQRAHPSLVRVVAAAVAFRLLFVASRSDWHGGFALGPRYLIMAIPFLIMPIAFWLQRAMKDKRRWQLEAAKIGAALLIAQQGYFVVGEVFSFYHAVKLAALARGTNIFAADALYLKWAYSPLLHLVDANKAPWILANARTSNLALWAAGSSLVCLAAGLATAVAYRLERQRAGAHSDCGQPE